MKPTQIILIAILICESYGYIYECKSDTDCLGGSNCVSSICNCPGKDEVFNSIGTKCLKLVPTIGGACEDNNQCSLLTGNYICNNNLCDCGEGYTYLKGKCIERKKNNAACKEHEDCFNGVDYFSRICDDGVCKCNTGYYERGEHDCRLEAKLNEACFIDLDCATNNRGFCDRGICATNTTTEGTRYHTFFDEEDVDDEPELFLDESCNSDTDCTVPNTYCSKIFDKCICKKGYYIFANNCVLEMGMPCTDDIDCRGSSNTHRAVCKDNICACEGRYIINTGNKKCVQETYAPGFYCTADSTCKPLLDNYECQENPLSKECQCKWGYKYDEFMTCSVFACISNESCDKLLGNSICTKSGTCECETGSNSEDGSCYGGIGSKCRLGADDCKKIKNSVCQSATSTCVCSLDYVMNEEGECIKMANMDEDCVIDEQCKFSNGVCSKDTNTCVCSDKYLRIENSCFKVAEEMYDLCTNEQICTKGIGPNVKCRNGICQCSSDMKPTVDRLDCENSGVTIMFNGFLLLSVVIYMIL